jgi:hypothetical protein
VPQVNLAVAAAAVHVKEVTMKSVTIKLSPMDIMKMKGIVLDSDVSAAIPMIRELLARAEMAADAGIKNHLDK